MYDVRYRVSENLSTLPESVVYVNVLWFYGQKYLGYSPFLSSCVLLDTSVYGGGLFSSTFLSVLVFSFRTGVLSRFLWIIVQ